MREAVKEIVFPVQTNATLAAPFARLEANLCSIFAFLHSESVPNLLRRRFSSHSQAVRGLFESRVLFDAQLFGA